MTQSIRNEIYHLTAADMLHIAVNNVDNRQQENLTAKWNAL